MSLFGGWLRSIPLRIVCERLSYTDALSMGVTYWSCKDHAQRKQMPVGSLSHILEGKCAPGEICPGDSNRPRGVKPRHTRECRAVRLRFSDAEKRKSSSQENVNDITSIKCRIHEVPGGGLRWAAGYQQCRGTTRRRTGRSKLLWTLCSLIHGGPSGRETMVCLVGLGGPSQHGAHVLLILKIPNSVVIFPPASKPRWRPIGRQSRNRALGCIHRRA